MRTIAVIVALLLAVSSTEAAPICLKGNKPFQLQGDTVEWSMQIKPGADCIQGLRWSFMQIYSVTIAEHPKHGELVLAGSGFRYFAKQDFSGTDSFALTVTGKNLREEGKSTIHVMVSRSGAL